MAERPGPITSFASPSPVGLPGDSVTDRLRRLAQVEPESFRAGQADFSSQAFVPVPEESIEARLKRLGVGDELAGLGAESQANPFGLPPEELRSFTQAEIQLKLQRAQAEADARAKRIRATQEDIRGQEIARVLAKVRRDRPGGFLPEAQQALVSEATEALDAQQTLQIRLKTLGASAEAGGELSRQIIAEATEQAVNPDRIPLKQVKDLLIGFRIMEEQERIGTGAVFDAKGVAKAFRAVLDRADEGGVRLRLKVELQGMVAKRESIPSSLEDAFRVSPLGTRRAMLVRRGLAEGVSLGLSEAVITGVLGEKGLADQMAAGDTGDSVAVMLGFMAGAMTNFLALDRALVKAGVRTFSGRGFPERLALETAMQDVVRIPGIVLNGRIQNLSDDQINRQIFVELGLGLLAGATLGLGGAAASFGVRKGLAGGLVLSREFSTRVARVGKALGRIAREAPEKFPRILDLTEGFGQVMTTMVGGVSGLPPRTLLRSKPQLIKIARAAVDQLGLSAGELGKVVRQVAPKRGASGKLEDLSVRELGEVGRRLMNPEPSVPRGTKLNDVDHLFFAVPAREADELRRAGVVPLGARFHAIPGAATADIKGKAEVFAIPASVVRAIPDSADARAAMEAIELPTLSRTMQGGKTQEPLSAQLRGFTDQEAFGLDPLETLLSAPVPGAIRSLPGDLGVAGKLRRRILPDDFLRAIAYKESYYGISRNMIEGWAPEHGRRYVQMVDQVAEVSAVGRGEFQTRYEALTRPLTGREINNVELAFAKRKELSPSVHPRVKKTLRELEQLDSDMMDVIEASGLRKMDGTPFRRLKGGHLPQAWARDLVEAVETGSMSAMKLDKTGRFRLWDEETKRFVSPSITGIALKRQLGKFKLYNEFIEARAREMGEKGMRYKTGTRAFVKGVGTKASMRKLKEQARHFFADHRSVVAVQQITRPSLPSSRDITEGVGPRPMGAIDFNRLFEYDIKFLRPNLGDTRMRHIAQLFDRQAEVQVFGEKLERLTEVFKKVQDEVATRLGADKAKLALESMRQLYARETGNLAVDASIDALAVLRKDQTSQWIRNLTAALFLGPGSTFQFGGNAIWAVLGAAMQVPVKHVVKEFGWATLASSTIGGTAGALAGDLLGDTPEEKQRLAALLGVLGATGGFGVSLAVDSTARALIPAVLPTAAFLAGGLLPETGESSVVERGLLAAGGWLGGTAAGRTRILKKLASSSTAVQAVKRTGALWPGGLTQTDLVTNALSPAFRGERGPLGEWIKDLLFGVIQATEIWARTSSAKAQLAAATEMIDKFAANPKLFDTPEGKIFSRQLERLGLNRKTVDRVIRENEGILPDALVDRVIRRGIDNTQYNLRPMDLPLKWSTPWGRIYTQFMGMQLRQFENGLRMGLQEAGLGNWMPLFKVVGLSLAAGWTMIELRDFVNGNDLTPRMRNKFTRFYRILGPAAGLFEIPLGAGARISEGVPPGQAAVEALVPASVGAAEKAVNILFEGARSVMFDDPDIKRKRGSAKDAIRTIPAVNAISTLHRRIDPTDEQIIEEFSAQMPLRLQEIEAAKQGKSLIDFLQGLPEPAFPEARRLAERAAPALEGALRGVASGLGFLPGIAPSLKAEEAKAESILRRLARAPGVLERRAALESRIKGRPADKPVTRGDVFETLQKRAESASRKGIIGGIATGIRNKDRPGVIDKIEQFMRMGGKAKDVISSLRQRALTAGDESLATAVPESLIHRLELQFNETSLAEVNRELAKRPRNQARIRALIEYRRSLTAVP